MQNHDIFSVLPDLAVELTPAERTGATEALRAAGTTTVALPAGRWDAEELATASGCGALVLDGMLTRSVRFVTLGCTDLIGPGDVLPLGSDEGMPSLTAEVEWQVLEPAQLAILDDVFIAAVAPWPTIASSLVARIVHRSQAAATHLAITCLVGVELRLFVLLWHLADRFGRVDPAGVVVPLHLTHEVLAKLVAARRPTVTTALGALVDRGLAVRRNDGSWLLRGDPAAGLAALAGVTDATGGHVALETMRERR